MPREPEAYVHRIGRTGRAQNDGVAFSFSDETEKFQLRKIERLLKNPIPVEVNHPFHREVPAFPPKKNFSGGKKLNSSRNFRGKSNWGGRNKGFSGGGFSRSKSQGKRR